MQLNREQWLDAAAQEMKSWLLECKDSDDYPDPLISVGFPKGSRGRNTSRAIGQCWDKSTSGDKQRAHIFIIPTLTDHETVLATLLHELVHACVGNQCGHRGPFKSVAVEVGLTGKMTATVASDALKPRLESIVQKLGDYPHPGLEQPKRGSVGSRLLKVECPRCGCIIRMTAKWLDSVGPPTCGCDTPMHPA
jgi:hypothetical protein